MKDPQETQEKGRPGDRKTTAQADRRERRGQHRPPAHQTAPTPRPGEKWAKTHGARRQGSSHMLLPGDAPPVHGKHQAAEAHQRRATRGSQDSIKYDDFKKWFDPLVWIHENIVYSRETW